MTPIVARPMREVAAHEIRCPGSHWVTTSVCDVISRPNSGRMLSTVAPTPSGPADVWRSSLPAPVQCGKFVKSVKKSQTSSE